MERIESKKTRFLENGRYGMIKSHLGRDNEASALRHANLTIS